MSLIGDIPAWLRSLRLHKYTPNFEGSNWKEMVMLDDAGLDAKGVNALGARRKLLKFVNFSRFPFKVADYRLRRVFEVVRMKSGMALPGDGEGTESIED